MLPKMSRTFGSQCARLWIWYILFAMAGADPNGGDDQLALFDREMGLRGGTWKSVRTLLELAMILTKTVLAISKERTMWTVNSLP